MVKHQLALGDLVFVGCNRRIAALHRGTGELVWQWKSPKGSGYVALLVDGDLLLASVDGYTFALDPLTGRRRWENPLTGFGTGVPCLASLRGSTAVAGAAAHLEEERRSSSSDPTP